MGGWYLLFGILLRQHHQATGGLVTCVECRKGWSHTRSCLRRCKTCLIAFPCKNGCSCRLMQFVGTLLVCAGAYQTYWSLKGSVVRGLRQATVVSCAPILAHIATTLSRM